MPNRNELPLIYSCSGCSDVAQLETFAKFPKIP